jgi:flagellar biogenesis protein FliO
MRSEQRFEAQTIGNSPPVTGPGLGLSALWNRLAEVFGKIRVNRRRSLRLCETLALGEKRIVAIVECDQQRFLLAATPQNISLLQALGPVQPDLKQEKSEE